MVEAVPEKLELKQTLFQELGNALGAGVLLATNTSSLPITRIANVTRHPERVVGMHFFNPVHIMKLVEVVQAERSSDAAVECAMAFSKRLGKDPIRVKDSPGFASSRLGHSPAGSVPQEPARRFDKAWPIGWPRGRTHAACD